MTHQADSGTPGPRVIMFCSGTENIGQSTTMIDTARLIAESGRRVLIVAVFRADRRAIRYLRSRLGAVRRTPPVRPIDTDTDGAGINTSADTGTHMSTDVGLPEPVLWSLTVDDRTLEVPVLELAHAAALSHLPAADAAAHSAVYAGYDTVLIDAPPPRTSQAITELAPLAHVLAACFTLDSWSVEAAAGLVRELRVRAGRPVDTIAVGLQVDRERNEQLRLARDQVRSAFRQLGGDGPAPYVEVPYDPVYDQDRAVPELSSDTAPTPSLTWRAGLAQLVGTLDRPRSDAIRRATVVYPPRHLAWAEWIGAQLSAAGVRSVPMPFEAFTGEEPARGSMLFMVSPTGLSPRKTDLLTQLSHPNARIVLVDEQPLPLRISHHEQIDLRRLGEDESLAALRTALRLPVSTPARSIETRFPRLPARSELPPRGLDFTGRDELCRELRDGFGSQVHPGRRCALVGPPGIGKSALALEFCHRFGGTYDTVWWLSADSAESIEQGLALLADRSGALPQQATVRDVLDWLESPDSGRWLLVYDDADEPAALEGLLPSGGDGHVLLTRREASPRPEGGRAAATLEVPPLTAEESRSLLESAVPGLDARWADRVGQTMGRVPVTLRLAGAWISADADRREADNSLRAKATRDAADRLLMVFAANQQEWLDRLGHVPLYRVMLEATLAELHASAGGELWSREPGGGDGLMWYLECCALLTSSGAELSLLRSPHMRAEFARHVTGRNGAAGGDGALSDPLMLDVALWTLVGRRLLDVDFARPDRLVRQNRVLRELLLERMAEADRKARVATARAVVAAHEEERSSGGGGSPTQRELEARTRQLVSLEVWEDNRPEVRLAFLAHCGRLTGTSERRDLLEALKLGARAEAAWRDRPRSTEYLRLHNLTARAHRQLGDLPLAARHALLAVIGHRATLGVAHPRALLSADSYGVILRYDGEFAEARVEGRHVLRGMAAALGPDHPSTVQTEHNLALVEALCGDHRLALDMLLRRYSRRRTIGGPGDQEAVGLLDTMALAHRGLGQNRESFDLLKQYLHRSGGTTTFRSISVEIGLAVSERRLGQVKSALERDQRVLQECRARYGDGQLRTERCRFSLAADLYAVDDFPGALAEIDRCLVALERTLGENHPYSHLSRIRAGVCRRAEGDREEALELGLQALVGLTDQFGPDHAWTAAAAVALAGSLVASERFDEARERLKDAALSFDEPGMAQHPDRALIAANLRSLRHGAATARDVAARHRDIDLELPGL